jgi:hypothetical protein
VKLGLLSFVQNVLQTGISLPGDTRTEDLESSSDEHSEEDCERLSAAGASDTSDQVFEDNPNSETSPA